MWSLLYKELIRARTWCVGLKRQWLLFLSVPSNWQVATSTTFHFSSALSHFVLWSDFIFQDIILGGFTERVSSHCQVAIATRVWTTTFNMDQKTKKKSSGNWSPRLLKIARVKKGRVAFLSFAYFYQYATKTLILVTFAWAKQCIVG